MADRTAIEWTDATWNPVVGCKVLSAGCAHCYAMTLAGGRLKNHPTRAGLTTMTSAGPVWNGEVRFNEAELARPMSWRRARKIFVCAHGDLFYEGVPFHMVDRVFAAMLQAPHHTYQVLTKRPERMREYITQLYNAKRAVLGAVDAAKRAPLITALSGCQPLPNLWLGVSAEDQATFDERVAQLRETPAAVRFLSLEPLLGPISTFTGLLERKVYRGDDASGFLDYEQPIGWVIVGGESGPKARPMHPDWVRDIRDECEDAGIAFFFKQWGEHAWVRSIDSDPSTLKPYRAGKRAAGHVLDGQVHHAFPASTEAVA